MAFSLDETVVILGTSRGDGNTRVVVDRVLDGRLVELVDLAEIDIGTYDYQHRNQADGFLPLVERIVKKRFWVLATPVYWYSMSAQMKLFVDRLSDLITVRKDLGRSLRGKSVALLASGTDESFPEGFESPFRLTCDYLGMRYVGAFYLQFGKNDEPIHGGITKAQAIGASWIS
jgi:multimeric flavodoxin WrbA